MKEGVICTIQELRHKRSYRLNELRYRQLTHFIETLPKPIRSNENVLPLEKSLARRLHRSTVLPRFIRLLAECKNQ